MKKLSALLLALLLTLSLAGCNKQTTSPDAPNVPSGTPSVSDGVSLTELNVELVADGHDADALLRIKRELPSLLTAALAERDVRVERVNVTFGTSSEATVEALARGTVQLAFLPTESYLAHEDALRVTDASLSPEIICYGTTTTERGLALRERNGDWSWDDLAQSTWALPRDEASFAYRWLDAYLALAYDRSAAELPNTVRYSADYAMDAVAFDLFVSENTAPFAADYLSDALALPYFFTSVAVVSADDAILSTDACSAILGEVLGDLSADKTGALYAYNATRYSVVEPDAFEEAFEGWRLIYDHEHGEA